MRAMTEVSPDLSFGAGAKPFILYRTGLSSDRDLLGALLKTVRRLTDKLAEYAEEDGAKAGTGT